MPQMSYRLLSMITLGFAISLSIFVVELKNHGIYAANYPHEAALNGQNEVSPTNSTATGLLEIRMLDDNSTLRYRLNVTGISDASGVQIYSGKTGENGPVLVNLLQPGKSKHADTTYGMIIRGNITDSSLQGPVQGKTLGDLISLMNSGYTYVNILTLNHPDGEIRGQIQNTEGTNSTSIGMSTLTE